MVNTTPGGQSISTGNSSSSFLKTIYEMIMHLVLVVLISGIVGVVLSFPIMLLWNFVFPFFPLTIWQAWALNVLMGILIGSKSNGRHKD